MFVFAQPDNLTCQIFTACAPFGMNGRQHGIDAECRALFHDQRNFVFRIRGEPVNGNHNG